MAGDVVAGHQDLAGTTPVGAGLPVPDVGFCVRPGQEPVRQDEGLVDGAFVVIGVDHAGRTLTGRVEDDAVTGEESPAAGTQRGLTGRRGVHHVGGQVRAGPDASGSGVVDGRRPTV